MEPIDRTAPTRTIELAPPFAAGRWLDFLAARAVPGVEEAAGGAYRRALQLPGGGSGVVEIAPEPGAARATVRVRGSAAATDLDAAAVTASRMLDAGADARAIDRTLAGDALLAPLVAAAPGTRVPGPADGFEQVVRAIVGQQVSVAGARTTLARLVARLGRPLEHPLGSVVRSFPTPERLADEPDDAFGMPRSRAATIVAVARAVARGELDPSGAGDRAATLDALAAIPGIGPWTLGYVAMRALGDRDAFPATDLGVRRGCLAVGLADDPASIAERAERWRPFRAYAVMHLWSAA